MVRWLDAADGRERIALKGHTAAVHDLAVLPPSPAAIADRLGLRRRHRADLDASPGRGRPRSTGKTPS